MQLRWIGLFFAAYFAFIGLYSPFLGPYLKSVGYSLDVIALALGLLQGMRIFGPFAWGWVADHTGNQIRWIRAGVLGGLIFAGCAFANNQSTMYLILMILLMDLSLSGLIPMSDAFTMNICKGCTGLYGNVRLYGSLGFVFSVVLFGFFAQYWGMESYPYWIVIALFIALLAALQFKQPFAERSTHFLTLPLKQVIQELFKPLHLRLFWSASFFMIMAHGVFYAYFSLFLLEHGYTESTVGVLWAIGVVCEIVFFALQNHVFSLLSLNAWLCLSFASCGLRFLALALFPDSVILVGLTQVLHSLTFAAHHTSTISWLRKALPIQLQVRGQAMYATVAYGFGGSLGTFIGRLAWGFISPSAVFIFASMSGFIALGIGLYLRRLQSRSSRVSLVVNV